MDTQTIWNECTWSFTRHSRRYMDVSQIYSELVCPLELRMFEKNLMNIDEPNSQHQILYPNFTKYERSREHGI